MEKFQIQGCLDMIILYVSWDLQFPVILSGFLGQLWVLSQWDAEWLTLAAGKVNVL